MPKIEEGANFYLNEYQQASRERARALLEQCKQRDVGKHLVLVSRKPRTYKLVRDSSSIPAATQAPDVYAQPRSIEADKQHQRDVAKYLRTLCREHSLSYSELGRHIGLSASFVSRITGGKSRIKPPVAKLLADYFNVDESNFL
ncbi:MAG: helix-turn-helix domain-containing protein [Muribaculaceae bacterium]